MTTAARKNLRPADDQPFDFNLNAVQAEVDLTPWRIVWGPENRRFTLLHLEEIDAWGMVEAASQGEMEAMIGIFRLALGDEWKAFREIPMPNYKLKALWDAYEKHCGVEPGESEGSTAS